jgi:hypothetical protein
MLPKTISNFIDQLFLATFNKVPSRIMKRVLWLLHSNPTLGDKWGYYIRQFHYYEPIPDFPTITQEQALRRRDSASVNWNLEAQLNLVKRLSVYGGEIQKISEDQSESLKFNFFNDFYFELDAAVYYALLREVKPSKVIEIGSGYSTQIAAMAIAMNQQEGNAGKIVCIEPYPAPRLTEANLEVELIPKRVETIDLSFFAQLSAGDILFIDSTHTVKFGSDVCLEILEILPAIPSGVWIHFHDIFFPYDYPPKWLIEERRAWNEQYMLEAFLAYNHAFEVVLANHWLSVDYLQEVAQIWPGVLNWKDPYHHCGSFWIRKK